MRAALKNLVGLAGALALLSSPAVLAQGDVAAGAEKTKAKGCQACHGTDGNGPDPQFPRLAGQHPDYLEKALADYKTGERQNAIMAGFAAALTEQDRKDIAAFYGAQQGLTTLSFDD